MRSPLTRGRPFPRYGGGTANGLTSGWHSLPGARWARCRWQTRATSYVSNPKSPAKRTSGQGNGFNITLRSRRITRAGVWCRTPSSSLISGVRYRSTRTGRATAEWRTGTGPPGRPACAPAATRCTRGWTGRRPTVPALAVHLRPPREPVHRVVAYQIDTPSGTTWVSRKRAKAEPSSSLDHSADDRIRLLLTSWPGARSPTVRSRLATVCRPVIRMAGRGGTTNRV